MTDRKPFKRPELSTVLSLIALCISVYTLHIRGFAHSIPNGSPLVPALFWALVALTLITASRFVYDIYLINRDR